MLVNAHLFSIGIPGFWGGAGEAGSIVHRATQTPKTHVLDLQAVALSLPLTSDNSQLSLSAWLCLIMPEPVSYPLALPLLTVLVCYHSKCLPTDKQGHIAPWLTICCGLEACVPQTQPSL